MKKTCCPLCSFPKNKKFLDVKKFVLVKCGQCGLVYLNPRPAPWELQKFYPHDYYGKGGNIKRFLEKCLTLIDNYRRRWMVESFKKKGKILDLGCGTGEFISLFDKTKWGKLGVEPNPFGYKIAKQKSLKIYPKELLACKFPNRYFDVIIAFQVLEHVHNPGQILKEIRRIMKGDGLLFLATPNLGGVGFKLSKQNWFHLDLPRHLSFYNKRTLKFALKSNGMKIIRINFPLFEYPLDLFHSLGKIGLLLKLWLILFGEGEIIELIAKKQ